MVVDYPLMSSVNFAVPDSPFTDPRWRDTSIAESAKSPSHSSTLIGNGKLAFVPDKFVETVPAAGATGAKAIILGDSLKGGNGGYI
jgi:hypothetical protein